MYAAAYIIIYAAVYINTYIMYAKLSGILAILGIFWIRNIIIHCTLIQYNN